MPQAARHRSDPQVMETVDWWTSLLEAVTNRILGDLVHATKPRFMRLTARFYVRGGIFTTVRAEHNKRGWKFRAGPDLACLPHGRSVR